jgi:Transcriptional regulator, AbiEi antitoxin
MNRPEVLQFLSEHHWVASTRQLAQLGVDSSAVYRARRRGLVRSLIRGTVVVAGAELTSSVGPCWRSSAPDRKPS